MRLIRVAARVTLIGLMLMVGVVAAVAAFGDRLLLAAIEKAGPALLGREIQVGRIAIHWGRHATFQATDLALADATWSANSVMLQVRRAEFTINILDLLRFRLSPVSLDLQQPRLHLARNAEGHWNLPQAEDSGASGGIRLRLGALRRADHFR